MPVPTVSHRTRKCHSFRATRALSLFQHEQDIPQKSPMLLPHLHQSALTPHRFIHAVVLNPSILEQRSGEGQRSPHQNQRMSNSFDPALVSCVYVGSARLRLLPCRCSQRRSSGCCSSSVVRPGDSSHSTISSPSIVALHLTEQHSTATSLSIPPH